MKKFTVIFILLMFTSCTFANAFINEKLNEQDDILDSLENEMTNIKLLVSSLQDDNCNLILYSESLEKRV